MNPLASVQETLNVFGQDKAGQLERLVQMLQGQAGGITPPIAAAMAALTGRQTFGNRGFTAPLGYGGKINPYGREPQYYNKVTGQIESQTEGPNLQEEVFQMLPLAQTLRDVLSGADRPFDTTGTEAILRNRLFGQGDRTQLYQPPQASGGSGRKKIPFLSPVLGIAGAPLYQYDKAQEKKKDAATKSKFIIARKEQRRLVLKDGSKRRRQEYLDG